MAIDDKQLIKIGPWSAGINNLASENSVPEDAIRAGLNIDIDNAGQPSTRAGYVQRIAGTRCHSGWHDGKFPFALFVRNGTLTAMQSDLTTFNLVTGLNPLFELSYVLMNDRAYYASLRRNGVVTSGGAALEWGVETPHGAPALTYAAGGAFPAGTIQVAVTFFNASGEESGAFMGAPITVPNNSRVLVSSIPQPTSAEVVRVRIYRTEPDDAVFRMAVDLPVGMTTTTLNPGILGRPLDTMFLERVPCAYRLTTLNGRIYFGYEQVPGVHAVGWTEAIRYGLWKPSENYIGFNASIDMIAGVGDGTDGAGMYVGAGERTYYLDGADPKDFKQKIIYPFGVIPGTMVRVAGSILGIETTATVAYWIARNGFACIGLPSGQMVVIRENEAQAPIAMKGASILRQLDGARHILTSLSQQTGGGMRVADRASAKVYRNGVEV
jgi:hypothetical protein